MAGLQKRFTRGNGMLESFLTHQRSSKADALIPAALRQGRVLDVGCGTRPYFLLHSQFQQKYGIDPQIVPGPGDDGINLHPFMLNADSVLPFPDGHFSAVVSLGTLEHFDDALLRRLFSEAQRLLQSGGMFVVTSPSAWTYSLLKALAAVNIVSPQEIREARHIRSSEKLLFLLAEAGFKQGHICLGAFQLGLNRWFCAVKS